MKTGTFPWGSYVGLPGWLSFLLFTSPLWVGGIVSLYLATRGSAGSLAYFVLGAVLIGLTEALLDWNL